MIKQLSGKRKLSMHKSNISSIGANWSATKTEYANNIRYLLEETKLVQFIIENGPKYENET